MIIITRPLQALVLLSAAVILPLGAADARDKGVSLKGAYTVDGQIYINTFGKPEGKPITRGHEDMKPSWSKTGGKIVFFRVIKKAKEIHNWKTAICVVNVDGTGFHKLTDGTHTDFNPTWTRDGKNLAVFNRRDPKTGSYVVMLSKHDGRPGDEYAASDTRSLTYAYSCVKDGRLFVGSEVAGSYFFLMTPGRDNRAKYDPVQCELAKTDRIDRASITPSETKICFELQQGFGPYSYQGRAIYIADFDTKKRAITNPQAIANEAFDKNFAYLYPRWTADESAIVYYCNKTGKCQLYMYRLKDGSTTRVSKNADADYMFPCGEETPK